MEDTITSTRRKEPLPPRDQLAILLVMRDWIVHKYYSQSAIQRMSQVTEGEIAAAWQIAFRKAEAAIRDANEDPERSKGEDDNALVVEPFVETGFFSPNVELILRVSHDFTESLKTAIEYLKVDITGF